MCHSLSIFFPFIGTGNVSDVLDPAHPMLQPRTEFPNFFFENGEIQTVPKRLFKISVTAPTKTEKRPGIICKILVANLMAGQDIVSANNVKAAAAFALALLRFISQNHPGVISQFSLDSGYLTEVVLAANFVTGAPQGPKHFLHEIVDRADAFLGDAATIAGSVDRTILKVRTISGTIGVCIPGKRAKSIRIENPAIRAEFEELAHNVVQVTLTLGPKQLTKLNLDSPSQWLLRDGGTTDVHECVFDDAMKRELRIGTIYRNTEPPEVDLADLSDLQRTLLRGHFSGLDAALQPDSFMPGTNKPTATYLQLAEFCQEKFRIDISVPWSKHTLFEERGLEQLRYASRLAAADHLRAHSFSAGLYEKAMLILANATNEAER